MHDNYMNITITWILAWMTISAHATNCALKYYDIPDFYNVAELIEFLSWALMPRGVKVVCVHVGR